ncbi:MAG: PP2C family protein-serine/threonine phosphatase [Terracidiphilus sp.]
MFVLQFVTMGVLGNLFPSTPQPRQMDAEAMGRMQSRLAFDGLATIIAMSLSYAGFVIVFVREGRRHARVHAEMSRQQALLEGELAAAREVQEVILPEQVEAVPGFKVESMYQPARQVGGDFFQVLPAGEGGLLVVIGDVAGKGLPAAMLVSVLVGAIRGAAEYTKDPAELLASLNDRLIGRTHGGFSTALVARIAADGSVTIANAGHLSPYLDGREVELQGALPLGVVKNASYQVTHFHLPQGSRLTFYSDGVIEAQNEKGELFGFERGRAVSIQPAAAIAEAARQFGQEDDITVVTIERLAADTDSTGAGTSRMLATA